MGKKKKKKERKKFQGWVDTSDTRNHRRLFLEKTQKKQFPARVPWHASRNPRFYLEHAGGADYGAVLCACCKYLTFILTDMIVSAQSVEKRTKKKKKSCRTITIPVRRMIERGWLFDWTQKTEQFFIFIFFHNNILKVGHVHLSQSLSNNNSLRFTLIFKCCLSHLEWI